MADDILEAVGRPELIAFYAAALLLMLPLAVNFLSKYVPGMPRTMYRLTGLTFPIPAAKLTPRLLIAAYRRRQLTKMLRRVELLKNLGEPEIEGCIDSLEMQKFKAGDVIFRQDDEGDPACFFVISGEAFATMQLHTFEVGLRVNHKRHGVGTVAEVTKEPNITKVVFDKGESHRYVPASLHKLKPVEAIEPRVEEVMQYRYGGHFGERALSRIEPRAATITCRTDVTVLRLTAATFLQLKQQQDQKENLLRSVGLFETFSDDQIATLAEVMQLREFKDKAPVIVQGDEGYEMFILDAGEAVVTIRNGKDEQEVKRYQAGELFGEMALLNRSLRAATVTAVGEGVRVWALGRDAFEVRLGSLGQLRAEQYLTDPRALIANFYANGDAAGPAGTLKKRSSWLARWLGSWFGSAKKTDASSWFAVYRPCSRDSIAKMVGRVGTGKGLNIKGKSAKKNRLSGFVPFVQISKNTDKSVLEKAPSDARFRIFYQSAEARSAARKVLESTLAEMQVEKGKKLAIDVQEVKSITEYEPTGAYGLDVPEGLLTEVYIMRPDVSPAVGWETGRDSEPAFLDMNRHALRDGSEPPVVLYQFDKNDPMNPLGLLMAYAEARVTPVVSDFDTFLVGSRGVKYDATPPEQVKLMNWALDHTTELLANPSPKGWMARWLNVLKEESQKGFHPALPKYGFGDPTSYGLIGSIVSAMSMCGAVRHGAECFNFYFPQELDPDFLVVWDGLDSPPWKTFKEPELRAFLLERAREGYSFPLNPVWPVRDPGWLEVLHELMRQEEAAANLKSWFPPESGVLDRIESLHAAFPGGFHVMKNMEEVKKAPRRASFWTNVADCETEDVANIAALEVRRETKARWRRVRGAMKMRMLEQLEYERQDSMKKMANGTTNGS